MTLLSPPLSFLSGHLMERIFPPDHPYAIAPDFSTRPRGRIDPVSPPPPFPLPSLLTVSNVSWFPPTASSPTKHIFPPSLQYSLRTSSVGILPPPPSFTPFPFGFFSPPLFASKRSESLKEYFLEAVLCSVCCAHSSSSSTYGREAGWVVLFLQLF